MNIYVTTTGTTASIVLSDLGERILTHPITNYNITSEFKYNELLESNDFTSALDSGYIVASQSGVIITTSSEFYPVLQSTNVVSSNEYILKINSLRI